MVAVTSPPSSEVAHHRARVAVYVRDGRDASEARRDLLAAKLEEQIKRAVAGAPPLTDEQRRRLAAIIRGGAA
jgi:hypothetical protein